MPRSLSTRWRRSAGSLNSADTHLVLIEIQHPGLTAPARVVNDTQDLDPGPGGHRYQACGFRVELPSEEQGQQARARIAIDNVGRELMQWVESSQGGRGATVRIMLVLRETPNVIEHDLLLDLQDVDCTLAEISGGLGYDDLLSLPLSRLRYDNYTAPGLF